MGAEGRPAPSGRAPSPYRPGMGLEPPYLGDRGDQMERFREFLDDRVLPHNVILTGLRGVGKTVLLKHYVTEASQSRWLVAEREFLEADAHPLPFAQKLLRDLLELTRQVSLRARLSGAAARVAEAAGQFIGALSVTYGGIDLRLGPGRGKDLELLDFDEDLLEAFRHVGRLCERTGHPGFVLFYDEFHMVEERSGWRTLSALLTATAGLQRSGDGRIILVLSGLPPLQENLARARSYSERMFTIQRLENLQPPEDRAALADPAARNGRRFSDEALEAVLADTGGYPFFLQFYGDRLWRGGRGEVIGLRDLERLRPGILLDLDRAFFDSRYARAAPWEQKLLHFMALAGERIQIDALQRASGWTNNQIQPALRRLVAKGLVYRPQRGVVAFTTPLFGSYLRRH